MESCFGPVFLLLAGAMFGSLMASQPTVVKVSREVFEETTRNDPFWFEIPTNASGMYDRCANVTFIVEVKADQGLVMNPERINIAGDPTKNCIDGDVLTIYQDGNKVLTACGSDRFKKTKLPIQWHDSVVKGTFIANCDDNVGSGIRMRIFRRKPQPCDCGIGAASRIANGYNADIKQLPWSASLRRETWRGQGWPLLTTTCGATILSDLHVLTAAECVSGDAEIDLSTKIYVGNSPSLYKETGANSLSNVTIHPAFDRNLLVNNLAILTLAKPLTFSDRIKPVCLPPTTTHADRQRFELENHEAVLIAGWGKTETSTLSNTLKMATLTAMNNTECLQTNVPSGSFFNESMTCVGAPLDEAYPCDGDSGSGMVMEDGGRHYIVGVASYHSGGECGDTGTTAYYTKVLAYMDWIESVISTRSCYGR